MTLSDLKRLLTNTNVAAFLRTIRERESSQDDSAYTVLNGGAHFASFKEHPYKGQRTPPGKAAGAYQFIASSWGDVQAQYGMPDFGPASQDAGAVARLIYRGALEDVLAGRFAAAVARCRHEWTSLPGASESSAGWTMDKALAVYRKWGGRTDDEIAGLRREGRNQPMPGPAPGVPSNQPTEGHMGGLAAAGLIGQLLQTVIGAFAPVARAKVEEAAGKVTDAAGAKALADGLMGVLTQVTGQADPVQATAAVLAPSAEGKAKLAQVEQATMLKLDEIAGFLETISRLQDQQHKRVEESRSNARAFVSPEAWKLRWSQVTFTQKAMGYGSLLLALLIAILGVTLIWIPQDARSAIINLMGQMGIALVTTLTLLGATMKDQNGFSFGGTSSDNAAEIAASELAARRNQENMR